MKTFLIQVFLGALLFAWGFTAGYLLYPAKHPVQAATHGTVGPQSMIEPTAPAQIDTLVIIKWVPGKIRVDTLKIYDTTPNPDASFGYAAVKVASMDTTITGSGRASVDYFFPPVNRFDFLFQPAPKRDSLIVQTVYVPKIVYKQHWYQKGWLWFAAGSAATLYLADHYLK